MRGPSIRGRYWGVGALLGWLVAGAPAQTPEFRAQWATRYEWPHANQATCQARIDAVMQELAAANFNAVFFQIRGQADVLYPSPYEVWSPLIGGVDPGWDPLAYAIAAAHANGLEFHAYINTHTCWQSVPASAHTPPANPNHLYYAHCNAADPAHRDWLHHSHPDTPVQFSESGYVWLAPGVPDCQAYIRRQVMYVVENYDVDGVHYDRIRTPWSNQPSYDPISLARFNTPQSNPDNLDFTLWTADQITRNVCDIYAAIMAVKPDVAVSAAVYSNPASASTAQHQEALRWLQLGGLDIAVPMMYFTGGAGSTWDSRLQAWLSGAAGRHVVAGHSTSQGINSLLEQVALTRQRGAQGNSAFSWGSFTWWNEYVASVYPTPAPLPAMPWKTNPATGIIYGYVTDAGGVPAVDARVTRNGSSYVALSTGDGFYSCLLVTPGVYTLTASHPVYQGAAVSGVNVAAGQVIRQDIVLGGLLPPLIAEVMPDPGVVERGQEYQRQLILVQGTAETWTLLDGPPGAQISSTGLISGWTPSVADGGQTFQFSVRATNAAGHDDETWAVTVHVPPPCTIFKLTDFEGYAVGEPVLFRLPRYSGSSSGYLLTTPNVSEVTDATAFSPTQAYLVAWEFNAPTADRWMRLTTNNAAHIPNPTIALDRPIRVRLRLDAGSLRLAVGIRETGTTAEIGADGGTSGSIEWVGVTHDVSGAPQGVLVTPQPGVWQTFVFNPLADPLHGMTGDGILWTATNKGVFEHLAFALVDTTGPFTVYLDDIDLLCRVPALGDLDGDADADLADFLVVADCWTGPDMPAVPLCTPADFDSDGDVDLHDFALFQPEFTGG